MRTCTQRRVEREVVRSRLHVGQPCRGIHQRAAIVPYLIVLGIQHHQLAVALLESEVNSVGQPLAVLVGHLKAVHHQFNAVVDVTVKLHPEGDFAQHAINAYIHVTFLAQVLKQVFIVSLTVLDQWREDINPVALVAFQYQAQDLVGGVFNHALSRQVGIGIGSTGIKQPQVVIHLGRRAHCTARIAVYGLLPDRDDGAKARYLIHIGAFQNPQHVTGIGGEGLQIASLPLGKDCVERQRRLAAAAESCDDSEFVMWNLHVYVLEVVDSSPQYLDTFYFLPVQFHLTRVF